MRDTLKQLKIKPLLLLAGVLFSVLLPIIGVSGTASAQVKPVDQEVKQWLYNRAIAACLDNLDETGGNSLFGQGKDNKVPASEATDLNNLFKRERTASGGRFDKAIPIGAAIDSSDDGSVYCDRDSNLPNWIKDAFSSFGADPNNAVGVMCDIGMKRTNNSDCRTGSGDFEFAKDPVAAFYANPKFREPAQTDAMRYWLHLQTYLVGCDAAVVKRGNQVVTMATANENEKQQARGPNGTTIDYVDDAGNYHEDAIFISEKKNSDSQHVFTTPKGDENKLSCQELAARASTPAYVNAFKSLSAAARPGSTGSGSAGGNAAPEESCETQSGGLSLGWILCGFIRIMDGIIGFFDKQIQSLLVIPKETYASDRLHSVWASFRNLALLILVPMMLVMVIGTAIGVGPFDPYTVKKALPRMIFAAIYIVLSWNIVGFLINIANVIGSGTLGIITTPVDGAEKLTLSRILNPDSLDAAGTFAGLFGGAKLAAWGLSGSGAAGVVGGLALVALVGLAIGWVVLLFRQIIVIALVIVAPLAILSWIFPGNDKLWKIWRESFEKLLIVFPIIMAMIGIGRVFASIIDTTGTGFGPVETVLKIVAFVAPYFFIKSAFALGGSAFGLISGKINDRSRGFFDKQRKKRAEKTAMNWERNGSRKVLQKRADVVRGLQNAGSDGSKSAFTRGLAKRAAGSLGGYNLEAAVSARNASVSKELGEQIATGADGSIRGLTVNKRLAESAAQRWNSNTGDWEHYDASTGSWAAGENKNALKKVDQDGKISYKSLGGQWISEAEVDEGQKRWGNDTFAQQAALSYEMRKAMTGEQVQGIAERYNSVAQGWGMSKQQADSAWIGAGFENQNTHLGYKNMDSTDDAWEKGGARTINAKKLANEAYEKKGSYQLSQMSSETIRQLDSALAAAQADNDTDSVKKLQSVAETFMSRYGGGAAGGVASVEDGNPIPAAGGPPATGGAPRFQTNSQGSGAVAEAVRAFAVRAGVYREDAGPYPTSDNPPAGVTPPDIERPPHN